MRHRNIAQLIVVLVSMLVVLSPALAQQNQCGVERDVRAQALDEGTYKQLSDIYEDLGEENYAEAEKDLQRLVGKTKDGSYAQAIVLQALGHASASQENYDKALEYFQKSVDINALPDRQHYQMIYSIAQLLIARERYREGLDSLELWFCVTPPENITANAYLLKASGNVELKNYPVALSAINQAIELEENPKENWYQMKLGIQFEIDDLPAAASTLETMLNFWPDKETYWKQLSSIYLNIKQENKALSVLALAHRKGMLDTSQEVLQLSSLYQLREVPYEAAKVLEDGINNGVIEGNKKYWEQAANAWYQARELDKALAAYEKAGQFSDDGSIDMRRAYILVDRQDWSDAKEALRRAIDKGGLKESETGNAYLLIGMAEMSLERLDAADKAFNDASRYTATRRAAIQWLEQVEQRRQAG